MANFIKKLAGGFKGNQEAGCCGVDIKPADDNQDQNGEASCCAPKETTNSCCSPKETSSSDRAADDNSKSDCC